MRVRKEDREGETTEMRINDMQYTKVVQPEASVGICCADYCWCRGMLGGVGWGGVGCWGQVRCSIIASRL